ncbi:alpha/beta hydrolase [Sphingomonas sp. VNH70]|uniref:alpha/beta hydrolase n=1 Tax=Sphingomonas silueang TaxID=3156617 RepID=UPI0032B40B46
MIKPLRTPRRIACLGWVVAGLAITSPVPAFAGLQAVPYTTGAPAEVIPLWPGTPPGMPRVAPRPSTEDRSRGSGITNRMIRGIATPTLSVFRPAKPNGKAVMVVPGGGYRALVIDRGGLEPARWLAERGYTTFVLTYRLPGEGWAGKADVPLADAQRAIRLIRANAARFGIDPAKIAAVGFSAGGHVCAELLTRHGASVYVPIDAADRLSARPWAVGLISAVIGMRPSDGNAGSHGQLLGELATPALEAQHSPQLNVTPDTPPAFIVSTNDDPIVDVERNGIPMRAALRARNVPVELHVFPRGGHNFGVRMPRDLPAAAWPGMFVAWLADLDRGRRPAAPDRAATDITSGEQ